MFINTTICFMKKLIALFFVSLPCMFFGQNLELNCSNIGIIQNDTIICKGDSIELSVPVGYNYLWSTGDTTTNIVLSPSETTNFSVQISSVGLIDTIDVDGVCDTYEFALGDVNYDQLINVQDIVLIVDWILDEEYNSCGDVNCDQMLNENDVFIIENFILGFGGIDGCINCIDNILVTVETCGCLDPLACNYCSLCTMDDGACWYSNDCNESTLHESIRTPILFKEFDVIGKEIINHRFSVKLFDDGSVQKEYLLK